MASAGASWAATALSTGRAFWSASSSSPACWCWVRGPSAAANAPSPTWSDMSDVVIRAEKLGKKFIIGHRTEVGPVFVDALSRGFRNALRKGADMLRGRAMVEGDVVEDFWALRDVDFEIRRGEVVSIIGHNGAGKTTLLKVLSRITEPTEGRRRFDEIVDFSGVEKFIDTPVKRYSVGMYARLAFAVAAHLESEVLVS